MMYQRILAILERRKADVENVQTSPGKQPEARRLEVVNGNIEAMRRAKELVEECEALVVAEKDAGWDWKVRVPEQRAVREKMVAHDKKTTEVALENLYTNWEECQREVLATLPPR